VLVKEDDHCIALHCLRSGSCQIIAERALSPPLPQALNYFNAMQPMGATAL
jgi:hypothetical protein